MDKYFCFQDAISDLNRRGYINDFILFGNDLLWVQQKIFIRSNDFSILECYRSGHPGGHIDDLLVFGILAISADIKGVLVNHFSHDPSPLPGIIDKLNKMKYYLKKQDAGC